MKKGIATDAASVSLYKLMLQGKGNGASNSHIFYISILNLLKPTGYVMHQQFNIQQLYILPTLYLCVLYLSQNKQRLVPLTT